MNRCIPTFPKLKIALTSTACAALLLMGGAAPAVAQQQPPTLEHSVPRTFPVNAARGKLVVTSTVEGEVDGKKVRLAPGLRILNPQNQLVFAHSVVGQTLQVRYVIEASTGYLLTTWILSQAELNLEPKPSLLKSLFGG